MQAKQSIFHGTIILTLSAVISKIIGAFYKIPLTNILGASGVGVYYIVFPFYSASIVLCSSGISIATSKLVAKHKHNNNLVQMHLKASLLVAFALSLFISVLTIVLSKQIAHLHGNMGISYAFVCIAPAIFTTSILSVFKGFFQGFQNMVPTSISMLIEQITKLMFGYLFAILFIKIGVNYSVFGALLGITISELITLVVMIIIYKKHKHNQPQLIAIKCTRKLGLTHTKNNYFLHDKNQTTFKSVLTNVIKVSIPYTITSLIIPIMALIDSFLVPKFLQLAGIESNISITLYGLQNGVVNTLISLPIIVTMSLATVAMPSVSELTNDSLESTISNRVTKFLKSSYILSLFLSVIMFVLAPNIIKFLYGAGLKVSSINELNFAIQMLRMSCVSIVYTAIMQTSISILQAISDNNYPIYAMLFVFAVRILVMYFLIIKAQLNIYGTIIADIVFLSIIDVLFVARFSRRNLLNSSIFSDFISPTITAIICTCVGVVLVNFVSNLLPNILTLVVITSAISISYMLLLIIFRTINLNHIRIMLRLNKKQKYN
ncbi:MAG: polysaccharide biosynthesis protein [Clostridia bacterium]|nr:polysaccharide biosynthesis protein [Clostridia bacterium]